MNYKEIISSIQNKEKIYPIYFLMGEEPYYINKISNEFTDHLLSEEQKEFNLITLYGKDTTTSQIISEAKQFPFGAEKRLVIIKEAQHLKNLEILSSYIENPQKSTVLVINYNGRSLDKRQKISKIISEKC